MKSRPDLLYWLLGYSILKFLNFGNETFNMGDFNYDWDFRKVYNFKLQNSRSNHLETFQKISKMLEKNMSS